MGNVTPWKEGTRSLHGAEQSSRCQASALSGDIWVAHFGLFAQCHVFVQPFNLLHWLECKHRPTAEVASLGHRPTIQGLGCLEIGANAANIVDVSFPLH